MIEKLNILAWAVVTELSMEKQEEASGGIESSRRGQEENKGESNW